MEKTPGWLEYRCRKCGTVYRNDHSDDADNVVLEIITQTNTIRLFNFHRCQNGETGLADFIAAVPDSGNRNNPDEMR